MLSSAGTGNLPSNLPAGWNTGSLAGSTNGSVLTSGSISGTTAIVSTGSNAGGTNYDFGSTNSTDRALGTIASSGNELAEQVGFTNATGKSIIGFSLTYTGEEWRCGGPASVENDLIMQFSTDGTNFTALGNSFNFVSPVIGAATGALDGNAAANRTTNIGGSYSLPAPVGNGTIYLRWADGDDKSNDDALAIDDFNISFMYGGAPRTQPGSISWAPTSGSPVWDHATYNFTQGTTQTAFIDNDTVSFDDPHSGSVAIESAGVSPTATTVTTNGSYTFTGGGILTGSLTKNGTGTLVLANSPNRYTGATNINAGTLVFSSDYNSSSQNVSVAGGATLNCNGHSEYVGALALAGGSIVGAGTIAPLSVTVTGDQMSTISGNMVTSNAPAVLDVDATAGAAPVTLNLQANVSGSTPLWLSGSGTIALNGDNTGITSNIQVYQGAHVILGSGKALGGSSARTYLNPCTISASTDLTGSNAIPTAVRLSSGVVFTGSYPIELSGAITSEQYGPILLTVNNTLTLSGIFSDQDIGTDNYVGSIIKSGPGTLIIKGANNNTGSVSITSGTLTIAPGGSFGDVPSVTLDTSSAAPKLVLMSATAINSQANFIVSGGTTYAATINIPSGNTPVHGLIVNGQSIAAGNYAPGDPALQVDGLFLAGSADADLDVVNTIPAPEPRALALFVFAVPFLSSRHRRGQNKGTTQSSSART